MMNKSTVVVLVVVALLVGGFAGFWIERSRATARMESYKMEVSKQMDDARKAAQTEVMALENKVMAQNPTMMATNAKLGAYVTDSKGMTLYTFDKDTKNTSNCTGTCLQNWPPYLVSGTPASTLPDHLGTMKRTDGTIQYTWDSLPLYYYVGDKKAGDAMGDGVGGVWHVAK